MKTIGVFLMLFCSFELYAQEDDVVKALRDAGFENVSRVVSGGEEIISFENAVWKANGEGVSHAIDIIGRFPRVQGKIRKVIVLSNHVPQLSLSLPASGEVKGEGAVSAGEWYASYELGDSWKRVRGVKPVNSSLRKVDLVFYPQLSLRNQKYHKVYDVLFNIAPALEISPVRGMKVVGQIIIPIENQYGGLYKDVRPGFITLQQKFRVENFFIQATVGNFNQNRWGGDLTFFRPFTNGWLRYFALRGQVGLTGSSYFVDWNWHFGSTSLFTWNFGASYYNPCFNIQCDVRVEKFLAGDIGVRADMTRHFKRASVGFYVMKNDRDNLDGGFHFSILLPPFRQKRKYVRVTPAKYFNMEYKAAGLFYNGKSYKTSPGQNRAEDNFNPFYIKSQL